QGRRRRHLVDAGDRRELLLERRRHGGRHGLGARARKARVHLDGGEVDVGQIAHREQPVGHQPEHEDAHHDEGRHDGALDEQLGDAHLSPPSSRAASATPFTSTAAPVTSRSWPSVTTSSPPRTPCAITVYTPAVRSTVTGCERAVPSWFTTNR